MSPKTRLSRPACLALSLFYLGAIKSAQAGDSPFGYVYTTDTHGQGQWEVEQWVTNRQGQAKGSYDALQMRTELEYGVTNNLQTSLYANYSRVRAYHNRADGTTGPGAFIPDSVGPDEHYRHGFFESISNEWIYRLMSPYTDPIGLAIYIEPSYGPKSRELETKIILQKNFLDDRLVWAGNATVAYEKSNYHGDWEKETELEFTTGLAYRFALHWHGGLEYRNHRGYSGYGLASGNRAYSTNYFGPSLHFADKSWWFTATFMNQLGNAKGYTDDVRNDISGGRFYGEDHERRELRLKVGFNF